MILRNKIAAMGFGVFLMCGQATWAEETKLPEGAFVEKFPQSTANFVMIPIKPGKYTTSPTGPDGKPLAPKEVEIKPFFIAQTEMTWDIFEIWAYSLDAPADEKAANKLIPRDKSDARSRPSDPLGAPDHGFGKETHPAISLTYMNAERCCKWLSKKTGKPYRLPTEAEWEYAASCGGMIPSKPMEAAALSKIAWYADNSEDSTQLVGKLAPNAWGLHDMLGNAGEWCMAMDGKTPVLRGGTYKTPAQSLHPGTRMVENVKIWRANEAQVPPSPWWFSAGKTVGFRVVMDVK